MEQLTRNNGSWRFSSFILLGLGLSFGYVTMTPATWQGGTELHTVMETAATWLALFIGILAMVGYYSKKTSTTLFIGTGFLGTAFLDGYTPLLSNPENLPAVKKLEAALHQNNSDPKNNIVLFHKALKDFSKYVRKMDESGKQLLVLINEMLDLSKIEDRMIKLDLQKTSVNKLVNSVAVQFRKSARDKGIILKTNPNGAFILADESRVNQKLINLVGNAIKFTKTGTVEIKTVTYGNFVSSKFEIRVVE